MPSAIMTRMKVQDYATWKAGYDKGEPLRREFKVRSVTILRDASEPGVLTVITRFDSVDDAKKMMGSDRWKEATKAASVAGMEVTFNDIADEKQY